MIVGCKNSITFDFFARYSLTDQAIDRPSKVDVLTISSSKTRELDDVSSGVKQSQPFLP